MKKMLAKCLRIILLIMGAAVVAMRCGEAKAANGGIIIENADYTWVNATEYSAGLINVAKDVTSRVVLEYGDFNYKLNLTRSEGLNQVASIVSTRIVIEYSDSLSKQVMEKSDGLLQAAASVEPRIIVEYADFLFSPRLGPRPWGPTLTYVKGVDVSHWQGDINWLEVYAAGYRFAFVKATEGDHRPPVIIDPKFETNMINGKNAGLLMGAYHVAHPEMNNAVDEALFFISVAQAYLGPGYLRPALDLEQEIVNTVIADKGKEEGTRYLTNWVETWMSTVKQKTGIEPIIYVSSNTARNYLNESINKYSLWIANYTYDPNILPNTGIWSTWSFWQYSDNGSVPGITTAVDLDLFNGDLQDLYHTFIIPEFRTIIILPTLILASLIVTLLLNKKEK